MKRMEMGCDQNYIICETIPCKTWKVVWGSQWNIDKSW